MSSRHGKEERTLMHTIIARCHTQSHRIRLKISGPFIVSFFSLHATHLAALVVAGMHARGMTLSDARCHNQSHWIRLKISWPFAAAREAHKKINSST